VSRISQVNYALALASVAASRSEDPYLRCGAAIIRVDGTVAALGYNGAPPGVTLDWSDRAERRKRVIHAESNALRYITPGQPIAFIATTHLPCLECIKLIRSYSIMEVFYSNTLPEHYNEDEIIDIASEFGMVVNHRVG
jgi:deoxycytidylate deaminase